MTAKKELVSKSFLYLWNEVVHTTADWWNDHPVDTLNFISNKKAARLQKALAAGLA